MLVILLVLCSMTPSWCYRQWRSVYDKITQDPDHSGFELMVKANHVARLDLMYMPLTVFVPENEAVDDYSGDFSDNLLLYHLVAEARTLKSIRGNRSIQATYADNPPLWVTVDGNSCYVNNAKIVEEKSNYVVKLKGDPGKNQVLHVIDQVLDPIIHSSSYWNATAYTFLSHYYKWKIGGWHVRDFLQKIQLHNKESLFRQNGAHTFFIPVDPKTDDYKWESIDSYIIEGHVVPNMVLFLRPTPRNFIFETACDGNYIYIVLSLQQIGGKDFVKSYTVLGNSNHMKGEVLSEIVKANIPVANGVVHLIKQPLAVFNRELKPFPFLSVFYKVSSDPDLSESFNVIRRNRMAKRLKDEGVFYTFFIPRNRAWNNYRNYTYVELGRILRRHVVTCDSRLSMAKLAMMSKNSGGEITLNTLDGPLQITANKTRNNNYSITWRNKSIEVYRPDYECNNGIVHILDDVFAEVNRFATTTTSDDGGFWRFLKELVM